LAIKADVSAQCTVAQCLAPALNAIAGAARPVGELYFEARYQPKGQGYHTRTAIVPSRALKAARHEILNGYPQGLATWQAMPLTTLSTPGQEDSANGIQNKI
jgi:hypothetical protein